MNRINYNNRLFKSISNSENGEVGNQTVFYYFHNLDVVTGTYSGGKIAFGQIMAKVLEDDLLDMRYQHVNVSGEIMTGKCLSTPEICRTEKFVCTKNGNGRAAIYRAANQSLKKFRT